MEVETYEAIEPENAEHAPEMEAEAVELIEELGLEGQRKRITGEGEDAQRNPFKRMTVREVHTYEALMGEKTPVMEFDEETIPVRVLHTVKRAWNHFEVIEVWHQTYEVKDPIVVGKDEEGDEFLIARWGEALGDFEELYHRAVERLANDYRTKCESTIADCQSFMANAETKARRKLEGDFVVCPA